MNYSLPWWPAASLDLGAFHFGQAPAIVNNRVYVPAITVLNLGARYEFKIFGMNSTLRVQLQNVADSTWWTVALTPGYFLSTGPRTVFAYLTTDI
jgi:iron complex outermembrane receptor protein